MEANMLYRRLVHLAQDADPRFLVGTYYFCQMISLCTIDAELSRPGTQVEILWGNQSSAQKRIRAVVAPAPYKPDKRQVELSTPDGATR